MIHKLVILFLKNQFLACLIILFKDILVNSLYNAYRLCDIYEHKHMLKSDQATRLIILSIQMCNPTSTKVSNSPIRVKLKELKYLTQYNLYLHHSFFIPYFLRIHLFSLGFFFHKFCSLVFFSLQIYILYQRKKKIPEGSQLSFQKNGKAS